MTNGFFVTKKTEEIRTLLLNAFKARGVSAVEIRNDDTLVGDTKKLRELNLDLALFWDKDVLLCKQLEKLGVRTINTSESIENCDDKGRIAVIASSCGLPTPRTFVAPFTYSNIGYTNYDFVPHVVSLLGFPMVIKESHGSFGQQVHLAHDERELMQIMRSISPRPMIFQEYIECGNSDLRLEVVGDEVVAAVRRSSTDGDFRANATLGGKMTRYEPTEDEIRLAVASAKAVGAEIAGVDLLQGRVPLLCEVNANAHFKRLMDATGIDVAGKIVDYVLRQ